MVETDHNSFFGKGPQTTDTSLGAGTTEDSSVRERGECQRPHSRGKQRISKDEVECTQFTIRYLCNDKTSLDCPVGGRIKHFQKNWEKISKDQLILETIKI